MTATQLQGQKALKSAEASFRAWAATHGVTVDRVLPLATFEERDPNTPIHIFFPTDADLVNYRKANRLSEIETLYRKWLT